MKRTDPTLPSGLLLACPPLAGEALRTPDTADLALESIVQKFLLETHLFLKRLAFHTMKLINIHGLDEILKFSRLKELLFTALVPRLCRGRCSRGVQASFSVTHSPLHGPGILMPPPRNEARDICFLTIPLTGLGRKKKRKKKSLPSAGQSLH